ncbi:MAG: response regulator [Myxococcales bacterium]|nr:response regulator [Myxococcales bacterium]
MNETIMVVDDDESNRMLLETLLDEEGYQVIEAANYGEMATALRTTQPDLILLDYMMDGKDGIEICQLLQNTALLKSIPIVMVSVVDDREVIKRGLEAGVRAWITKPVRDEEILKCVRANIAAIELENWEAV